MLEKFPGMSSTVMCGTFGSRMAAGIITHTTARHVRARSMGILSPWLMLNDILTRVVMSKLGMGLLSFITQPHAGSA